MEGDSNNGHDTVEGLAVKRAFEGGTVRLEELQRQDGILAKAADQMASKHNAGIIMTFITAENDDNNARQILQTTIWKNTEEQDKAVMALAVCDMVGAVRAKRVILNRLSARKAGLDGRLQRDSFEAVTHTTFIFRNDNGKGKINGNSGSSSPISS